MRKSKGYLVKTGQVILETRPAPAPGWAFQDPRKPRVGMEVESATQGLVGLWGHGKASNRALGRCCLPLDWESLTGS